MRDGTVIPRFPSRILAGYFPLNRLATPTEPEGYQNPRKLHRIAWFEILTSSGSPGSKQVNFDHQLSSSSRGAICPKLGSGHRPSHQKNEKRICFDKHPTRSIRYAFA